MTNFQFILFLSVFFWERCNDFFFAFRKDDYGGRRWLKYDVNLHMMPWMSFMRSSRGNWFNTKLHIIPENHSLFLRSEDQTTSKKNSPRFPWTFFFSIHLASPNLHKIRKSALAVWTNFVFLVLRERSMLNHAYNFLRQVCFPPKVNTMYTPQQCYRSLDYHTKRKTISIFPNSKKKCSNCRHRAPR